VAPLLNWYFKDPEDHIVINIGHRGVACLSFGLPRNRCEQMEEHAFRVSLVSLKKALDAGLIHTKS